MAKSPSKAMSQALGGKSKAKANSAAPVTRVSVSDAKGSERSVDVRKIANGYIVRESVCGPKGYTSTERFTEKAPTLDVKGLKGK